MCDAQGAWRYIAEGRLAAALIHFSRCEETDRSSEERRRAARMLNQAMARKSANLIPCQMLYQGGGGGAAFLPACKDGQPAAMLLPLEKPEWRPQGYNAEGSLPNSQSELDEDDEDMDVQAHSRGSTSPPDSPTTSGPPDSLHLETRDLLYALFREQAGGGASSKVGEGKPKALETLRRVGAEIIDKHQMAFQGMLQRLAIQSEEDIQKLSEVPSMVFSDGKTNWGRIVTLISFGAFTAKHLKSIKLEGGIQTLADNFTDYLMSQKKEWIIEHQGWDGCVDFFHVEDYESGLRTVLMAFAGVAGLGVSLAYMIR